MKRLLTTIALTAFAATSAFAASDVTPPKGDTSGDTNFSDSATTTGGTSVTVDTTTGTVETSMNDGDGKSADQALAPTGVDDKKVGDKE